jgi:hypothetical protein
MRLLIALIAVPLAGCTTIRSVAASSTPGEVYVTVAKSPFPQGYILRCSEKSLQSGDLTMCVRILNFAEAGQVGPSGTSSKVFKREGSGE